MLPNAPVMAKNTFRQPERIPKQKKQRRQLRLASWLNDFIGLDRLFGTGAFTLIGLLVGGAASLYLIYIRYVKS